MTSMSPRLTLHKMTKRLSNSTKATKPVGGGVGGGVSGAQEREGESLQPRLLDLSILTLSRPPHFSVRVPRMLRFLTVNCFVPGRRQMATLVFCLQPSRWQWAEEHPQGVPSPSQVIQTGTGELRPK